MAASSLKQLLSEHRVSSRTLRALDSCRQPQQLHAAVKLVWRKLPSATQAIVRADVHEWVSMCAEAVPSTPTPADRFQFLQKCHAAINEAQAVSDWVTTALDLSTVLPRAVDPSPIAEVQCGRTFRAALIAISKQEDLTREHLRQALKGVQQVLEHAGAAPQPSQSYNWFLNDTATSAAGTAMVSPAAPPAVVERAVTALPTGPSPAKISSATLETSSAPSVTASSPVGAVIQPPVPPDARALRANNLHRERTVQEYNALLSETMRPLTQFTSNDVARGFGHVYVSADTFDKYFCTEDSIDIHHPGGWFLRLRGRSNAGELYKTDADFRAERRQQAVGMSKRQKTETGSVVPHTPPPKTYPTAQAQQGGPPAVPVSSQHPYMPWSPVPTPGPYYTSWWPSWEGSQPGYGAPPTPQAFQAPQPPALPTPGTTSTTAVPTGALPESTTWAEYAQAQNAPAEGAWRHGWALLPFLPVGYECPRDLQDLVRLAASVVRNHEVGQFVRQLLEALPSAVGPPDTPDAPLVLSEWTCCWDCRTLVSLRGSDCAESQWSCPVCRGGSRVHVPSLLPSTPLPPQYTEEPTVVPVVYVILRRLHAYPGPWCQRLAQLLSAWCRCLLTHPRRLTCYGLLISPPIFCDGRPVLLYAEGATAFQAEPYFVSDVVPMVRVFAANWCTTCGRPRVAQVIVVAAPQLGCQSPRAICTCLPPGAQPVDKQLAARTSLRAGIQLLEHVVPVSSRSPPPPWGAFNWGAGEWGPAPL